MEKGRGGEVGEGGQTAVACGVRSALIVRISARSTLGIELGSEIARAGACSSVGHRIPRQSMGGVENAADERRRRIQRHLDPDMAAKTAS